MLKFIRKSHWLVGGIIFFMPILLILYLGSQMAYSQGQARFDAYHAIPEITRLSEASDVSSGEAVLLRGIIAEAPLNMSTTSPTSLLIYQERPAEGREIRYRETFPLIFPSFVIDLPDSQVTIIPSDTKEHIIQSETHSFIVGDRAYTGFQVGDTVTVQGELASISGDLHLIEATGITGSDKATLLADWQKRFVWVRWARNGFGWLSLVGIILLIIEFRRTKRHKKVAALPQPEVILSEAPAQS
ncbi:MAG: hypothetical protein AAF485_13190 [Chloroflexota bacterium]